MFGDPSLIDVRLDSRAVTFGGSAAAFLYLRDPQLTPYEA